jgi:hypothetical protein
MGDSQNNTVRVDFDRAIKLEFHGSTVTSDVRGLRAREEPTAVPPGSSPRAVRSSSGWGNRCSGPFARVR